MKFNWKANWEILLVLVIIVIGIVITTIAAIRNKDKHLPYPAGTEEADFGQLFPTVGVGNSIASADDGGQQQQQQQLEVSDYHKHHPPATGPIRGTKPAQSQTMIHSNSSTRSASHAKVPARSIAPIDNPPMGDPVSTSQPELYEPPTTTEPSSTSMMNKQQQHLTANNKRHVVAYHSQMAADKLSGHKQTLAAATNEFAESLDDIHTTRSSLAGGKSEPAQSNSTTTQQYQPVPLVLSPPSQQQDHTPSLAFHGPYGGFVSNPIGGRLEQYSDNQLVTESDIVGLSRPAYRANDTRGDLYHSNQAQQSNSTTGQYQSTDQVLLANLLMQQQQQQQQQEMQDNSLMQASNNQFRGSLPISLLLGDLLKLTQSQNFQNSHESGSDEMSSANNNNNRYNRGILQQIRSLPGPLMALLGQNLGIQQQQTTATGGQPSANHDTSESNQNFDYRISMSPADIHSIFARSLASRSADSLPAFPAPKGVLQPWVAPTSGGSPNHTEAQSSQAADFIASNTAGFVRAYQQQQQQQQASDLSSQQYPSMDSPFANTGQQQQQQLQGDSSSNPAQQQDNFAYTNQNHYQPYAATRTQDHLGNQLAPQTHLYTNQQQQQQQQQQQFMQQPAASFNQAPVYPKGPNNLHRSNEIVPVPLGYSPPSHLQLQASNQQQQRPSVSDFGGLESSPKVSISAGQQISRQPIALGSINTQQRQTISSNNNNKQTGRRRRKRSLVSSESNNRERQQQQREQEFEAYASKYNDRNNSNDDDDDSYPLSVVSPDGRPLSNERFRGLSRSQHLPDGYNRHESDSQMAQSSQRASSHVDHHADSTTSGSRRDRARDNETERQLTHSRKGEKNHSSHVSRNNQVTDQWRQHKRPSKRTKQPMEMAGSDLMSKLLGTASTNSDESEMDVDMDDDDDDVNERRKEELEDAEFGIVNDHRPAQQADSGEQQPIDDSGSRSLMDNHHHHNTGHQPDDDDITRNSGGGSTSSADESSRYSERRNHQQPTRSDIEFYGHPGEETRQLKYGILGSGNYEVVNGGIYPEADESTAAVNSVAKYARKPASGAGGGLLAKIPGMSSAAAFMPGGRIGGFLRGSASSANLHDTISAADLAAALMPLPAGGGGGSDDLARPLLDLIDAGNGHYLNDANLINQLSSSGSSSRTSHTSKDNNNIAKQHTYKAPLQMGNTIKSSHHRSNKRQNTSNNFAKEDNHNDDSNDDKPVNYNQLQQQQSSISGSRRAPGGNQFHKYHILPSKKVTIFSEQDLDSAPSSNRLVSVASAPAHSAKHQAKIRLPAR